MVGEYTDATSCCFLLLPVASYCSCCSQCLLLVVRCSIHTQQKTSAVSCRLPLSPNVYNPSKLHIVTHRYTSLRIVYSLHPHPPTTIHQPPSTGLVQGGNSCRQERHWKEGQKRYGTGRDGTVRDGAHPHHNPPLGDQMDQQQSFLDVCISHILTPP